MNALNRRVACAALGAMALSTTRAFAQTADLPALHLASSPADDTMAVLYAEQTGAFRRAGLDVQLSKAGSGSAVAAAVTGGSVDVGKSSIVSVVTARAKGIPLTWIAPASIYFPDRPDGALIVANNSPIKTAKDLNGKIVAVPALGDLNAVATRAWSDQNGGDSRTIQFVEIPVNAQPAALAAGRVAAGGIINPFLNDALASGDVHVLAPFYTAIAPHFMMSGWFTTEAFANAHRDLIASFQRVVAATVPYTNAHHEATAPIQAAWSGITLDQAQRTQPMRGAPRILAADIQPVIDMLAKYNVIAKSFDAREMIVEPRA